MKAGGESLVMIDQSITEKKDDFENRTKIKRLESDKKELQILN